MSRRHLFAVFSLVVAMQGNLMAEPPAAGDALSKLPPRVQTALAWLPAETETLFVATIDGKMKQLLQEEQPSPDEAAQQPLPEPGLMLEGLLLSVPLGPLYSLADGKYAKLLAGQPLKWAIEGSGQFRGVPKGPVGITLYSGCHLYLFEKDLGEAGEALMRTLLRDAPQQERLAGHWVAKFSTPINDKDSETWLISRPLPNLLVVATDRKYLQQLLQRMTDKKLRPVAFPPTLPHWNLLDPTARYWAMRRIDGVEPDAEACGFVFSYSPRDKGLVRYRQIVQWASPRGSETSGLHDRFRLGDNFGVDPPVKPTVTVFSPKAYEMRLLLQEQNAVHGFWLLLYWALGHQFSI